MDTQAIIASLRATGIAALRPLAEIGELREYFETRLVYADAHMPETARKEGRSPLPRDRCQDSECICVPMRDAILAPYLFERGLDLRDVAASYLETYMPLAYSMNAFWTRPGPAGVRPDIQDFHRDEDDPKGFVAMFCYLTDVITDADGPHELCGPDGLARRVYGTAGTMFLADTRNLHRGIKPTARERGIAWLRWGVSDPPPSYLWDKNAPIAAAELGGRYPADPAFRASLRLLVTP